MTVETLTSENAAEFYASRLPKREEAPAADDTDKTDDDSKSDQHGKPKTKPIQPRINELVAERNIARDEAEAAKLEKEQIRRELDELKAQLDVLKTPAPQKELSDRPQRTAFTTEDDFQEALTDWKVEKRLAEKAKEDADARQRAAHTQLIENWQTRLVQARTEFEDYDAVVGAAEINLPQWMLDAIVESEHGTRVAYHLAKNTPDAKRLLGLTPTAALRELGKLEDRLSKEEKAAPESKTVPEKSKAPTPLDPLKGSSNQLGKAPSEMTYEEWKAARIAGKIK